MPSTACQFSSWVLSSQSVLSYSSWDSVPSSLKWKQEEIQGHRMRGKIRQGEACQILNQGSRGGCRWCRTSILLRAASRVLQSREGGVHSIESWPHLILFLNSHLDGSGKSRGYRRGDLKDPDCRRGLSPAYSLVVHPLQAQPHLKIGSRKTQDRKFWYEGTP